MTEGIRYARAGGRALGYQVVGDGAADRVYVPDFVSNLVSRDPRWGAALDAAAAAIAVEDAR